MFIRCHMTPDPICIGPAALVREIVPLLELHRLRHLPVVNERKHVLGLITDHELRAIANQREYCQLRAHDIMRYSPVTIDSNAPFEQALAKLCRHRADALLVLEAGALVGIVTRADLLRALAEALALDMDGSSVEVSLQRGSDLVTAFDVLLHEHVEIRSGVVGRVRAGAPPVLLVRSDAPNPRVLEAALAEAGLAVVGVRGAAPQPERSRPGRQVLTASAPWTSK